MKISNIFCKWIQFNFSYFELLILSRINRSNSLKASVTENTLESVKLKNIKNTEKNLELKVHSMPRMQNIDKVTSSFHQLTDDNQMSESNTSKYFKYYHVTSKQIDLPMFSSPIQKKSMFRSIWM